MKNKELIADILRDEHIDALRKIIRIEIDNHTLEKMPPTTVVLKQKISEYSTRDVTVTEMLNTNKQELAAYLKMLDSIEALKRKYLDDKGKKLEEIDFTKKIKQI